MRKIIEVLNEIFAPRITYYYNGTKVDKLPKEAQEAFKRMDEFFKSFDELFKSP